MVRNKRPLVSSEDQALFLSAIEGTQPLAARDRVAIPPAPPSPIRVTPLPPTISLTVEGDGQRYAARAPGVNRAQLNDLWAAGASSILVRPASSMLIAREARITLERVERRTPWIPDRRAAFRGGRRMGDVGEG